MTLKQIKAFCYAVEEGTLTKGAEKLEVTQSNLTHLILDLEEELGFKIMVRNKAGVSLTEEGRRIFPIVKELLDREKELTKVALKIKGESSSRINVGTFTSVAVNWLPQIMKEFKKQFPEVEFSLTDGGYGDILSGIETGSIDIGFVCLPIKSKVKCYPLYKDRILAVLPKGHKYANLERVPVEIFSEESVISLGEKTDLDSRNVFETAGIIPNIKYRTTDDYAMISMVENGLGICLEPELILLNHTQDVVIKETVPPSFRTIAIAVPYEKQANPYVIKFAEFIENWIKETYGEIK